MLSHSLYKHNPIFTIQKVPYYSQSMHVTFASLSSGGLAFDAVSSFNAVRKPRARHAYSISIFTSNSYAPHDQITSKPFNPLHHSLFLSHQSSALLLRTANYSSFSLHTYSIEPSFLERRVCVVPSLLYTKFLLFKSPLVPLVPQTTPFTPKLTFLTLHSLNYAKGFQFHTRSQFHILWTSILIKTTTQILE